MGIPFIKYFRRPGWERSIWEFPLFHSFGVACRDHFGTATPTISHGFHGNPREKPQNLSVTSTKLCLKWAFRVLKSPKFPQMVGTRRHRAHKRARHRAQKRGGQSARVHPRVRDPKWDFPLGSRNNSFRGLYNNSLRGGSRVISHTLPGRLRVDPARW